MQARIKSLIITFVIAGILLGTGITLGALLSKNSNAAIGDTFYYGDLYYTVIASDQVEVSNWGADFEYNTDIPSSVNGYRVTRIGDEALSGAYAREPITIPNTVTSIGNSAFRSAAMNSITIPDSVTSIGDGAFDSCRGLTSIILGNGVTTISDYMFSQCDSLESINIPNNVTSVGNYAFENCTSLKSVTIGEGVTSIGNSAFQFCNSLTSINIPNNVTSIGRGAFYFSGLETVVISESVTSISEETFSDCNSLTTVSLPAGLTSIGSGAFASCSSLETIEIPNSVTSIEHDAFMQSGLTSITIPGSVANIDYQAFYACISLKSVTLEEGVKSIGNNAFNNCPALTTITLPASLTSLGSSPFADCSSLSSINVVSGNMNYKSIDGVLYTYDGSTIVCYPAAKTGSAYTIISGTMSVDSGAFYSCQNLISVIIPDSVTIIGDYAFSYSNNLEIINIPEEVTSIGRYTFRSTALKSIIIPHNTTSIGDSAFNNCGDLTSVYFYNDITSSSAMIASRAFTNGNSNVTYYFKDQTSLNNARNVHASKFTNTNFVLMSFNINVSANNDSYGRVAGAGAYNSGASVTLEAFPNTNYRFVGWQLNGEIVSTNASYLITVTSDATYIAIFEHLPTITITTNSENYGRILYNNSLTTSTQVIQDSGTQITNIYAISAGGYAFLYWEDTQGFKSTANPLTYTVNANTTLTAVFGKSVDGVVVTASTGGEARIVGFDSTTAQGTDTVTLIAVAYTGYTFSGWQVDGEMLIDPNTNANYLSSARISYSILKDKIVTAIFTPIDNLNDMNSQTDNGYNNDFA